MYVPHGTSLKTALVVARLLESDLNFRTPLTYPSRGANNLYFGGPADVYSGDLEVWWTLEIDARDWGIKEMVPTVTRVRLHGYLEAPDESRHREGEEFSYDSADKSTAGSAAIGADVDAPTAANVVRLATQWKLEWGIDKYKDDDRNPTTFIPTAEVDVARRHIKILF